MNNIIKFPQNLSKINKMKDFRKYCLNPCGIEIQKTSNFKEPKRVVNYINYPLIVHRTENPLDKNTFVLKTDPSLTKPELKQILEKLYGLDINKIQTLNTHGKLKRSPMRKIIRQKDEKKAYITLNTEVNTFFQKVERNLQQ